MMNGTDYRFNVRDRVRLRNTIDPAFYGGYACVGNEAVVTQRHKDSYDLPEIYVKWDKNHWTYNGVNDCWTFEDHFDLVEGANMPDQDHPEQQLRNILDGVDSLDAEKRKRVEEMLSGDFKSKDSTEDTKYNEAILSAMKLLEDCEAFVVIGVARQNHPDSEQGILIPAAISFAKTPEGELLAMSGATAYGAKAHQELTIKAIAALSKK
jgi:hypothetical protein